MEFYVDIEIMQIIFNIESHPWYIIHRERHSKTGMDKIVNSI